MLSDEDVSLKERALKTVVKGAGIGFAGLVISNIILYLNRLILARYLGAEEYGLFYLGISIFNIIMIFVSLELSSAIIRYAPYYAAKNDEKRVRGVFNSALKINISLSIVAFLSIFIFSDWISVIFFHNILLSPVLKILSVLFPFFALFKIGEAGVLSFKRMDYCAFVRDFLRPLLTLILTFVILFLGFGLEGATISYTGGFACAAIIFMVVIQKKIFPFLKRGAKASPMGIKMLKYSIPIILYFTFMSTALRVDTIILGALRNVEEVGLYQTALPTSQFLTMPSIALSSIFIPVVSELLSRKKEDEIKETYKIISKWSFYISMPMFLVMFFWPDAVINALFGNQYIAAGELLAILSIGFLAYNFSTLSIGMISLMEKTKFLFINGVIALAATIFLNYTLVSLYGATGAAIAMAIVYTMITSLSIVEVYYFFGAHPFHRDISKATIAGLISAISVYYVSKLIFANFNIFILLSVLIVFLFLYLFLLLLLKGIGKEDIMILRAMEKKTGLRIGFLRKIMKRFI